MSLIAELTVLGYVSIQYLLYPIICVAMLSLFSIEVHFKISGNVGYVMAYMI